MINVTSAELESIVSTIDEALVMHDKWRGNLNRVLACKLVPMVTDMAEDAHRQCVFGQWLYGKGNAHLREMPAFVSIGELHHTMHISARGILTLLETQGKVPVRDYDAFLEDVAKFQDTLTGLKQRVAFTLQNIDSLTGAFQRARLLPDLTTEQKHVKESGAAYSLLLLDIDLKEINQHLGHSIGDKVLRACIFGIRDLLNPKDKIYRYSGAEFVICLPGKNMREAEQCKELVLKKIGEALVDVTGQTAASLHVHYGVVELDPNAYIEELIGRSARSTYTINL